MKSLFQSRPLHITACVLLFWKGISVIIWFLLQEFGMSGIGEGFFFSTGFVSSFALLVVMAFSDSQAMIIGALAVMGMAFLAYWVFFVLMAANRGGAGVASVALLVLCGLDLPITVCHSFMQWWSILVCIAFHATVFITVALLRRSRPGASVELSKIPDSI